MGNKLLAFIVICLIVLILIAVYALADNKIVTFNSNSQFNIGIKTNVETSADICTLQSINDRFSLSGDGTYIGITDNCTRGARGISSTSILSSYDMQTLRTGKLKDFLHSGSTDCTLTNNPPQVTALFGQGTNFTTASSQFATCTGANPTTSLMTIFLWVKTNGNGTAILELKSGSNAFALTYGINCNGVADNGKIHGCMGSGNDVSATMSNDVWHAVAWELAVDSPCCTQRIYIDRALAVSGAASLGWNTGGDLVLGKWVAIGSTFNGIIDEVIVWNRALPQIPDVNTTSIDGRNSFNSDGNWLSAVQPSTNGKTIFNSVTIFWSPAATINRYISAVAIKNDVGNYIGLNTTLVQTGTGATYIFATSQTPDAIFWTVQVNLTGDFSGTISVYSISVNFDFDSQVTLFANYGWVFGFIGMLALGLIGAYWIKQKRNGQ